MNLGFLGATLILTAVLFMVVHSELSCYLRKKSNNEDLTLKRYLRLNPFTPIFVTYLVFFMISSLIMITMGVSDMVYGIVEGVAFIVALLTYFVLDLTKDSKELEM